MTPWQNESNEAQGSAKRDCSGAKQNERYEAQGSVERERSGAEGTLANRCSLKGQDGDPVCCNRASPNQPPPTNPARDCPPFPGSPGSFAVRGINNADPWGAQRTFLRVVRMRDGVWG